MGYLLFAFQYNRSINEYYAKCDGCLVKYKKGIVCVLCHTCKYYFFFMFTGIINKVTKSYVRNVEQLKGKGLFAHCKCYFYYKAVFVLKNNCFFFFSFY